MNFLKNFSYLENIILLLLAIVFPWSIMFATPQLHIGYWGQVEGMIIFNHFLTALVAVFLIRISIINKDLRKYFLHPLVLLPALVGFYTIFSSIFIRSF